MQSSLIMTTRLIPGVATGQIRSLQGLRIRSLSSHLYAFLQVGQTTS